MLLHKMSCRIYFGIFLILISLPFFSCADSETDVVSASSTVIFDFKDNDSAPSARLAVFLQVTNEVQRTESITVTNEEIGYIWNISNPGIFTGMNKKYAFSLNLSAPEGENIPKGSYKVKYSTADGEEDESIFLVNYNEKLLTSTTENFKEFLTNASENIAVYDDSDELLFMGKAKSTWKTNAAILKDYRVADKKRACFVTPGNTVICMLPEQKLKD